MKNMIAVVVLVGLVSPAFAALKCGSGCYVYQDICACDAKSADTIQAVVPSTEKPPTDKMPSYQREGVTLATVTNLADQDAKFDQDKRDAESEGKKTAGIK